MNPAVVRKKTGSPDVAATTDSLHLQSFTPMCKYLNETRKLAVTEQMLSQFAYNILQFMETQFGTPQVSSTLRKKMVKLPYSIFRDFRIAGGLCTVFETSAKHTNISNWITIDLMDAKNTERGIQLLLDVENALMQMGLIHRPVFCLGQSVHAQPQGAQLVRELSEIALSHGGSVTEDQQKASFVVLWDEEVDGTLDRELQEEYIRPLELRSNQDNGVALVHWWYHPDSYDEWIPSQDVQCTDTPDADTYMQLYQQGGEGYYQPAHKPPATTYVCCRYLRDVQHFNEWGNLLDYEMDKPYDEGTAAAAEMDVAVGSSTRKSRGKKRSIDRRQHGIQRQQQNGIQQSSFVAQAVSVTEKMLQDLPPPSVQDNGSPFSHVDNSQTVNIVDVMANQPCSLKVEAPQNVTRDVAELKESLGGGASSMDVADQIGEDQPEARTTSKRKRSEDGAEDGGSEKKTAGGATTGTVSMEDSAVLKAPPSSVADHIHQILPNTKLPTWFHADAISAIEMKCKIAGDVAYIVRVHEFLDAFGVINYNPEIKVAFRNPKSAIFYSTCPSGASTSHKQLHKIEKESLKQSMWNDQLDTILMQAVTSALGSGNASFDDAAHEVGGINWQQVATAVASQVEEQKQMQFTSVACLVRFTEMSLGEAPGVASVKSVLPGSGSTLATRSQQYVASSAAASKHVRALAGVVTGAAAELLGMPQAQAVARAVQSALQSSSEVPSATVAAVSTGAALVSSAAQAAAKDKVSQAETYLDDYISLRLSVLEKKMELVGDIEDALLLEKGRAELDRHDLQVQRAQHAASSALLAGDISTSSLSHMGGGAGMF